MFTKEQREELIEKIISDCRGDPYNYADFVSDCVSEVVETWLDKELARWTHGDDCYLACVFCEEKEYCELDCEECPIVQEKESEV